MGSSVRMLSPTVIESYGSTSLVQLGTTITSTRSAGAAGRNSNTGFAVSRSVSMRWTFIGAEQTAGGYKVAMQCRAQTSTRSGTPTTTAMSFPTGPEACRLGIEPAIKSLEPSFQQDLNGDGMIGAKVSLHRDRVFGSTSLVQLGETITSTRSAAAAGRNSSTRLACCGRAVYESELIAMEQTASGYKVAMRIQGTDQIDDLEHRHQWQFRVERDGRR